MEDPIFYKQLVERYLAKKATDEEIKVFFQLMNEGLLDKYVDAAMRDMEGMERPAIPIDGTDHAGKKTFGRNWKRLAVAAAVTGLIALGVFYFNGNNDRTRQEAVAQHDPAIPPVNDVEPGGDKAVLTLGDGSTITLDNAENGELAAQGNLKVIKLNAGQLAYKKGAVGNDAVVPEYNTISTPRGGRYEIILPDETRVWLNAASSLRFPTAFVGNERVVELSGESYFEVAHRPDQPFKVKFADGAEIKVLGTHFNIQAYKDETIRATLLEGAIEISKQTKSGIMKPGQQAVIRKEGDMRIISNVDTEEAIAWKNGYFQFNRADITTIMRQIERWYDVEVEFRGNIPDKEFVGKVSRNARVSEVLKILELSKIHFIIEGKKIIVMP
ncbi:MAG TPA: DUF4974 domain-containing protein [Flavitalea sp.]|nr:DUF4974 domain-containing protein [Flavitalea sp.]